MTRRERRVATFWGAVAIVTTMIALTSPPGAGAGNDRGEADLTVERRLEGAPVRPDVAGDSDDDFARRALSEIDPNQQDSTSAPAKPPSQGRFLKARPPG